MKKDIDAAFDEPVSNAGIGITASHDFSVWVLKRLHVIEPKFCNRTQRTTLDTGDDCAAYEACGTCDHNPQTTGRALMNLLLVYHHFSTPPRTCQLSWTAHRPPCPAIFT